MQTVFTAEESVVLEHLKTHLFKFGVTLIDNQLTLRTAAGCVQLRIESITPGSAQPRECMMCGSVHDLRPATVTVKHESGESSSYQALTCSDCRCPK